MFWVFAASASGPITLNVDVDSGIWKAARLKNLPRDAFVSVEVESNGEIIVLLMDSDNYERFSENPRPLFHGKVDKKLSFSISVPETGHYYLVFDNRSGSKTRAVKATVNATRGDMDQTKTAEEILNEFETNLHQIFVFNPFPIRVEKCGAAKTFVDSTGIVLCDEYANHLYETLGERKKATNALLFTIFHEVGHILLAQWNYPFSDNEEVADEFATLMMVMTNQEERALAMAKYFLKNPSISEWLLKLFRDDRHPLSVQRSRNIIRWLRDPQFALKWQAFLVPHMQTAILKKLQEQPTSWTDLSLVKKELAERSQSNHINTEIHSQSKSNPGID